VEIGIYKCPECGSQEFIYVERNGDTICPNCGLVLAEKNIVDLKRGLKPEAYKYFYGPSQAPWSRRRESGSMFGFSRGFRDINLNFISSRDRTKFERLRKSHRLRDKKSIDAALEIFRNIINKINTPQSVKLEATKIFLECLRRKLTVSRGYEAIIGAVILIAYAKNNYPKSITELAKRVSIPKEKIFRYYQLLIRELKIQVNINLKPEDFISQLCSEVHTGMAIVVIEQKARKIIKEFQEKVNTSGKNPKGIAVAAIYMASKREHRNNPQKYRRITQEELASVGDVTTVTLRTRCKEIKTALSST